MAQIEQTQRLLQLSAQAPPASKSGTQAEEDQAARNLSLYGNPFGPRAVEPAEMEQAAARGSSPPSLSPPVTPPESGEGTAEDTAGIGKEREFYSARRPSGDLEAIWRGIEVVEYTRALGGRGLATHRRWLSVHPTDKTLHISRELGARRSRCFKLAHIERANIGADDALFQGVAPRGVQEWETLSIVISPGMGRRRRTLGFSVAGNGSTLRLLMALQLAWYRDASRMSWGRALWVMVRLRVRCKALERGLTPAEVWCQALREGQKNDSNRSVEAAALIATITEDRGEGPRYPAAVRVAGL